jgi:hypothetical protein
MGDSFAQDFANMANEAGAWADAQVRTIYVPAICQMAYVPEDVSEHIAPIDRPGCARNPDIRSSMQQIAQADIVVLAALWAPWAARLLPQTVANMNLRPDQRLFVVGPKRFVGVNVRRLLSLGEAGRAAQRHQVPPKVSEVNAMLKAGLPAGVFIDQIGIVCGPEERCPLVTDEDGLIAYDGGHLTRDGAAYIGKRLFTESALAQTR